jgi:hypothetical protein
MMFKSALPRAGRSLLPTRAVPQTTPSNLGNTPRLQVFSQSQLQRRGYATEAPEYDVLFIGGGVAGYVGAIKSGQEGLKVSLRCHSICHPLRITATNDSRRQHVSKSEARSAAHVSTSAAYPQNHSSTIPTCTIKYYTTPRSAASRSAMSSSTYSK